MQSLTTQGADSLQISSAKHINEILNAENAIRALDSINAVVVKISENTHYSPWVLINVAIATAGVVISSLAAIYSYRTATNVRRVNKETQKYLFVDLIRHLYRNEICTLAMAAKMASHPNQRPSDDHILKLKTLPEDIHLEAYNDQREYYEKLHEISLLMRNYNTEVDVFQTHLNDPDIPISKKKEGLNTLLFKPFYISQKILEAINDIDKTNRSTEVLSIILSEHCNKLTEGNAVQIVNEDHQQKMKDIISSNINGKSLKLFFDLYEGIDINDGIDLTFSDKNRYAKASFKSAPQTKRNMIDKQLRATKSIEKLLRHILIFDALIEYSKIRMFNYPRSRVANRLQYSRYLDRKTSRR